MLLDQDSSYSKMLQLAVFFFLSLFFIAPEKCNAWVLETRSQSVSASWHALGGLFSGEFLQNICSTIGSKLSKLMNW